MDGKLPREIGAAVFVGHRLVAMTLVQLREEPEPRVEDGSALWVPDGDPLAAQLRAAPDGRAGAVLDPIAAQPGQRSAAASSA